MSQKYTSLPVKRQHNLGIRESSILAKLGLRTLKVGYRLWMLIVWFCRRPFTSIRYVIQLPELLRADSFAKNWTNSSTYQPQSGKSVVSRNPLVEYVEYYDEGPGIFKWNHYLDIYHQYLQKFIDRKVSILEVGVYSGGSLKMWRNYLGDGCTVYGVDILEDCKKFENEYTKIFIGDQGDEELWNRIRSESSCIDILIDDGSHHSDDQIVTFEKAFAFLSPGGVFICEDIHGKGHLFLAYLQGLLRNLHISAVGGAISGIETSPMQAWMKAIHFYPYMVVIEKSEHPNELLISQKKGSEWVER